MTNDTDNMSAPTSDNWQLNALTEALGDLTLTVTDSLSVGRGSDNDVVLGSKEVSRNHAQLTVLNGQLYVKDLASSNGTFINDERIAANESKHLAASDTLGFASFSFQVIAPVATMITEQVEVDKPTLMLSPDTEIAPIVEAEPVVKETIITEVLPVEDVTEAAPVVATMQPEQVDNNDQTVTPVVRETGITEILSAADKAESVEAAPRESVAEQPVIADEPVLREAPVTKLLVMAESTSIASPVHETEIMKSAVELEHDKTTTTVLQEEADPDVLRAKQAATSQFSGTANLGQPRDVGTEGNNALDQALNNPATSGAVEKKASGSWFIWVFIAIIIIGLALWLFNTGMV